MASAATESVRGLATGAARTADPLPAQGATVMADVVTHDRKLASYLVTLGHRLQRMEGDRGRRAFVFSPDAESDRLAYFRDDKPVSARRLFDSYRFLKNLMFESAPSV
jgi:hypothetical protein